jgi:hypothetical protein
MRPGGPAFRLTLDRLARYARPLTLRAPGIEATAMSQVASDEGAPQTIVFPLSTPLPPGARLELIDTLFDRTVVTLELDAAEAWSAAMVQLARLEGEVAGLRDAQAVLLRRVGTALDLGREDLLLQRLDLFYLLLSERIERATRSDLPPDPPPPPRVVRRFEPADVDGIGIFEVETDGRSEWRWFGPDATIALRDVADPVRRVVLYFHGFGTASEPPGVRVSIGGPAEPAMLRALEGRYALDIPVFRAEPFPDRMLIVHLAFDRYQTSEADPRLLSAVFSGAEVFSA